MKRLLLILLLVTTAAVTMQSCSKKTAQAPTKGSKPIKIALLTNGVSDFWLIGKAGAEQAAKELGVTCEFRMPSQGTATEQKQILEDMIIKGMSGIAISPLDPENQTDVLNNVASKVNLVTTDSDAPESKRLCYIGTDNYKAGRIAGKELMKALPNGGKIMIFVGTLDAQNAHDRNKGITDEVKGSKIQILGTLTDNMDRTKSKANVEDTLVKVPDIAALVGLWSYNGPLIADAVKAAGKSGKIKIVCFDEDPSTLSAVRDGTIQATVVQKPYEFGYQSVKLLTALARGEEVNIPKNKIIDTGVEVITKSNVDKFEKTLKQQIGKK